MTEQTEQSANEQLRDQVLAIVNALQAPKSPAGPVRMPCEVTACMPVYNGLRSFAAAVCALGPGAQSVPVKLLFAENGSTDGVQLVVRGMARDSVVRRHWMQWFRDIDLVEVPQNEEYPVEGRARHRFNVRECYREMFVQVDTPYLLMVDVDVEAPHGALRTMLEAFKTDDRLGIVGITYDFETAHVQGGMAMMRTDVAKDLVGRLEMRPPYACMCSQMCALVAEKGLKVTHLNPLSARHWRLEG
jgi:hypothetical protein